MNINFLQGVHDKTEAGLQASAIEQAILRLVVGIPFVAVQITLLALVNRVERWAPLLIIFYLLYITSTFLIARYKSYFSIKKLLIFTVILDPLWMSAWLVLTNEYGSLVVGFYLFTILGYGFRINPKFMYLCQFFALIGFVAVFFITPFWRNHSVIWISFLIPLLVVPIYATTLIKKLHATQQRAERESQAKSELLAKVSHELRTPLTGIIAATELLAVEAKGRQQVAKRTETILALSNELLSEINDLLDEAKYGARAVTLSYTPIDLHEQFDMLHATLETMTSRKGLELQTVIDPGIIDNVISDAHHISRVLLNLAGNAVKFTDNGNVRLAIELIEATDAIYRIRFSVTDTGIGIPESFHAKIFEPFSQVDQGASRRYGGTGLGLTLSKKIVELMGGNLQFESAPGKGSRFWFDLALKRSALPPAVIKRKQSDAITPSKRILVAEDNMTNLLLIKELLEVDSHNVTTCTSGIAALELLAQHDFDLILLDYNLGDMDGVRVLQTYQFGRLNPAPVLFLTADATLATANRLKAAGGAGVLYKPIKLATLRKALVGINIPTSTAVSNSPPRVDVSKSVRPTLTVVAVSPFDQEVLEDLKSVSTRPDFLALLLTEAERDITRNCQRLLDALSARNPAEVREAAHALKGVCANIGAVRLQTLASNLMSSSSEELGSTRERLQTDIREASRITLQALRKIVVESRPNSGSDLDSL